MKIDLHFHYRLRKTDAQDRLAKMVSAARLAGLDAIAVVGKRFDGVSFCRG